MISRALATVSHDAEDEVVYSRQVDMAFKARLLVLCDIEAALIRDPDAIREERRSP